MVCGRYIISENIVYQSDGFLRYSGGPGYHR